MAKTEIALDETALAAAAQLLGTKGPEETVNAALRMMAAMQHVAGVERRTRALQQLIKLDEEGAFDDLADPGFERKVWE
ncbi:type II toxin-antitoxin system VapB family antitoxin [Streptomyces sp. NPDC048387]|uniref:type II toxin-antitoxin system VapB family antitoxin n=1 Tax=Streptomyces sp. NPDC048387 TaxID=3365542 RepID=UPI0037181600